MTLGPAFLRSAPVPSDITGQMVDSAALVGDGVALRARLQSDGYLYLRGALSHAEVLAARAEVLGQLEAVDEIEPGSDGLFTGRSRRDDLAPDRGEFWRSVSAGESIRRVSHGPKIQSVMQAVLGGASVPLDYLMLRVGVAGRATEVHFDYPFFTRLHDQTLTVWTAIGSVPVAQGPLFVVEGSHTFEDHVASLQGFDVTRDDRRTAAFEESAVELAIQRGTRLLTSNYEPGDIVVFGMYTAHGTFEHHDDSGRVRVSCDARWQLADLPVDERYMEPDVSGTTGTGYAELNGARPLTEQWHVR